MNRRELLLFGGVMAASGPVCAQQKPMPRIGLLYPNSLEQFGARAREGFYEGLRSLGWIEGKNVSIEYRFADGDVDGHPDYEEYEERRQEGPRAAKTGKPVGQPLAERAVFEKIVLDVLRDGVLIGDAFNDLPVEFGELTVLVAQYLFDIEVAVAVDLAPVDQRLVGQAGMIRANPFG